MEKESMSFSIHIFATDIDQNALTRGREANYSPDDIRNVPYGFIEKYFVKNLCQFKVRDEIIRHVHFSVMDILDKHRHAPAESVFGDFDLIACRNVLIYFKTDYQEKILKNLFLSLSPGGYLMLGETETPGSVYREKFRQAGDCGHIYQKQGDDS
ncbi:MAG: hypothetical protein HQK55_10755 [Deltaproteobacteria bacterium]|nr:hypothetical protein [Deltaproteobacteria bacterium]